MVDAVGLILHYTLFGTSPAIWEYLIKDRSIKIVGVGWGK